MNRPHRLLAFLRFAGLAALTTASLHAGLIAHEPFDYAEGLPLHGAAGGLGWLAAARDDGRSPALAGWAVQRARTDPGGYRVAARSPLVGRRLGGSAAHLVGGWDYLAAGRTLDAAAPGASPLWSDGERLGKPGRPIYIAALLRADAAGGSVFLNVHSNRFASQVDRERVSWGVFGNTAAGGFWGLRAADGDVVRTEAAALPGEPVLLLVKLEFAVSGGQHGGQASLWVNPTADRPLPAPAVGVETGDIRFHSLAVYLGAGPGGGAVDEIRVALTPETALGATR
jgi:hypothetical protein